MHPGKLRAAAAALAVLLAACGPQVRVAPTTLGRLERPVADLAVPAPVRIELPTGYIRTLAAGSAWRAVGTLPHGIVYQPVDSVFTIEGRNVHEAYLVVREGHLHGFYLPGENNYSPLAAPLSLPLAQGAKP